MLVTPEERQPLAELFYFLELGEQFAHECAAAQSALAPTAKMRQFLEGQARQEAFHATVFRTARAWIAPRSRQQLTTFKPLDEYAALMTSAIDRQDFYESILAEQVILESLGEAILQKLEAGLQKRQAPFQRLRRILLHQEAAHHGFGERVLEHAMINKILTKEELQEKASPYLALTESMVMDLHPRFEDIDEDPAEYVTIQRTVLPKWLTATQA